MLGSLYSSIYMACSYAIYERIMLYVDIPVIYLACRGQKNAIIPVRISLL